MCKLLAIVDIENLQNAERFLLAAKKPMTCTDNHGLGVMRLGADGISAQRWLDPEEYPSRNELDPYLQAYSAVLFPGYNEQGTAGTPFALAMHSRFATCDRTLQNVHPFIREGHALIHNGIIQNHKEFKKEVSTCDSEAILAAYLESRVSDDLENCQLVVDILEGSYAFILFNEQGYVDIVKDDSTHLHIAHVTGVGTVFCTTEEIIRTAAKHTNKKVTSVTPLPAYTAIRWSRNNPPLIKTFKEPEPLWNYGMGGTTIQKEDNRPEWLKTEQLLGTHTVPDRCEHGQHRGTWCKPCYDQDTPAELRG